MSCRELQAFQDVLIWANQYRIPIVKLYELNPVLAISAKLKVKIRASNNQASSHLLDISEGKHSRISFRAGLQCKAVP